MQTKQTFKNSWKSLWANFSKFLLLTLFVLILVFAVEVFLGDVFLGPIISLIVSPVYYYLLTKSSLDVSRGDKLNIKKVLKSFNVNIYKNILVIGLIIFAYMFALGFVSGLAGFLGAVVSIVVFFALILASIYFFSGIIFFAYYLVIDKKKGAMKSIKASVKMSSGKRIMLLKNLLLLIIINVAGMLLFGVGIVITLPFTSIYMANIYNSFIIKNNN